MEVKLCDYCHKAINLGEITVSSGYGSKVLDGVLNFCDDECLMNYWKREWKKVKIWEKLRELREKRKRSKQSK